MLLNKLTDMKRMQFFLLMIVLLFAVVVHAKTASEVFDAVSSSIVVIHTYDANGKCVKLGSGVIVASDEIATNCHVIKDGTKIQVMHLGREYPATLRHGDWDRDVCTLTVTGIKAPAVVSGSTRRLKVGARVYAIGAPQGLELTLSEGIISSVRPVDGGQYLQITAPISPGSSGGGLFDEEGRLIGLPTFYLSEGQQLNFAVPVEWIWELPKRHGEERNAEQITTTDWINKASALIEKRDWSGLVAHSLRWTKAHPRDVAPWCLLAVACERTGQRAKQIEACRQVVRLDPEAAGFWCALGIAYADSGQYGKAIEALKQALRINPEDADAWYTLGNSYARSSIAKAIEAYQQALRINPEYVDAWFNLGICYKASSKTAKLMEVYNRLKAPDPASADRFFNKVVLP
jgi:hypothetical protein